MSVTGDETIGGGAIGETPSPYAEGGAIPFILGSNRVIYACEVHAGSRGWEAIDYDDAIGSLAIGEGPEMERTVVSAPLYVATHPYVTEADQDPPSARFSARLRGFRYRRSINNGTDFGGVAAGDDAAIEIDNDDGSLDGRREQSISGRNVVVRAGIEGIPYEYWIRVFVGEARDWDFGDKIRIALRDRSYRLGVPIQPTLYAGTGGIEGGEDLAGKRKPLVLGYCPNVSPPRVDGPYRVYHVHDGAVDEIFAVRDRGLPLSFGTDRADYAALIAASIAPGSYDTCLAEGVFRLGADPDGTVTADVATYRATGAAPLATIVRGILEDRTTIDAFYEGAWSVLLARYPGDHGIYVGENDNASVKDVVEKLMRGVAGWLGFTRDGQCTVGVLDIPDNPVRMHLGMGNILDAGIERLPSALSPPPWRYRLSYQRNWTQQSDIPGSADFYYSLPAKTATASDPAVLLDHFDARDDDPLDSYLIDASQADAEALRQHAIFKEERPLRRAPLSRKAIPMEIGDVMDFAYDRLGGRRLGLNVEDEIRIDGEALDTIELVLYG